MAVATDLLERFRRIYPGSPEPKLFRAPGRINLIGEHTDYNLGFVLPMAIDLECRVAIAPSRDSWMRVFSEQLREGSQWRMDEIHRRGHWSDRVAGIAWELERRGIAVEASNILISSSVPVGGGLSSSAALGVAMALALGGPKDQLAQIAHTAEVEFVGVPCGIMDQFAAAAGGAKLLDCRSLEWKAVSLPQGISIVAVNSMVKHELGDSAYRTRVAECAEAAREIGVAALRDASMEDLSKLSGTLLKRARHVITEDIRTQEFASADVRTMGRLMIESHRSLRNDYEVSCPELDFLVETAMGVEGVFGARMTGGGFGGSTVNLVASGAVRDLEWALVRAYRAAWNLTPDIHICTASPGGSQIV